MFNKHGPSYRLIKSGDNEALIMYIIHIKGKVTNIVVDVWPIKCGEKFMVAKDKEITTIFN